MPLQFFRGNSPSVPTLTPFRNFCVRACLQLMNPDQKKTYRTLCENIPDGYERQVPPSSLQQTSHPQMSDWRRACFQFAYFFWAEIRGGHFRISNMPNPNPGNFGPQSGTSTGLLSPKIFLAINRCCVNSMRIAGREVVLRYKLRVHSSLT